MATPKKTGSTTTRRFGATSYDVARLAGVSQSAVSRCFTPGASVAEKTRVRILAAVAQLGYEPNAIARGLIARRTNLVAVLISNLTNLYYPDVLSQLGQQLSAVGLRTLLFTFRSEGDAKDALNEVWRHRVDGAIAAVHLDPEQVKIFAERGIPLVFYNRMAGVEGMASSVCCDSNSGERLLVEQLLAAGHRRFGLIGGPADSFVGEERLRGAIERLSEAGLPDAPVVRGKYSYESGRLAMTELLRRDASLDAVISVNDMMALGAVDVARETFGRTVPDDLSVVGFDGIDAAAWSSYRLTSIKQPVERMTKAAVQMLMERIEDHSIAAERRLFAGKLIKGTSARIGGG